MIVCESTQKPLILFHLVHSHRVTNTLVFTKSAESTTRLVRLFEFFEAARTADHKGESRPQIVIQAYSSDSGASERKAILEKFKAQEIQMCVSLLGWINSCSDFGRLQLGLFGPHIPRHRH